MPSTSDFLKLSLPGNGEFVDSWDQEVNKNFTLIDTWAKAINTEITDARFGASTLKNFLQTSHNNDGSLKATPEVLKSRSSFVYGDETPTGSSFELADRLFQSDKEVFGAREGFSDLRSALAVKSLRSNMVIEGPKDVNGYPTWLGHTGINVQVDGSSTPVQLSISGFVGRIRKLEQIQVSGAVGVKHLYAQFNTDGIIRVDGDSSDSVPATANGKTGSDTGGKVRIFEDTTIDFTQQDVKVGDVLDILSNGAAAGRYQIKEVAPNGNINRLLIYGVFPAAMASLNYVVRDPMAVTLGFDDVKTLTAGKFYFGEADWDGTAISDSRVMHFQDYFIGEWRAVDLTSTAAFTEIWNHKLFDDALDVEVQVSQANDGSQPVEALSLTKFSNSLNVNNSIQLTNGDQTLSGTVTMTGSAMLTSSAKAQWTAKTITVSNATANVFYYDFAGVEKKTGYVRVVIKKLRK